MEAQKVIVGEFENELYAQIAKRDLKAAGINAKVFDDRDGVFLPLLNQAEAVQLIVPDTQVEEARKILEIKFM